MHAFLMNPIVHGALVGLGPAIGIDLVILKSAHSWSEFLGQYNWKVATYRYCQGALFGAIAGGGLSALFGL